MSMLSYVASYDEVRALLGASDEELADATIGLRVFVRSLEESLNEVDESLNKTVGTLLGAFSTVSAIASGTRTAQQQRFFENVQSFSSYHVASDLAASLPQWSPKSITDGKAALQRHTELQATLDGIAHGKARSLARLKRAYAVQQGDTPVSSVLVPLVPLLISVPDNDPVTG